MKIACRQFLNTDPPLLVRFWQNHTPMRGIAQGITARILEEQVFSKIWFDPAGLIIGFVDDKPAGFVHAGFVPAVNGNDLDRSRGVISQLRMIDMGSGSVRDLAAELLKQATDYLRRNGAVECAVGSWFPWAPFYQGIYGGSRVPGILADDSQMMNAVLACGFRVTGEVGIFHRRLEGFRPRIDRRLQTLKRQYAFTTDTDPGFRSWWDACSSAHTTRMRFGLRSGESDVAEVTFWDMQPIASSWGARAMGMYDLVVRENLQRSGLATCLLNESLRQLSTEGVGIVEAQSLLSDARICGCFEKLGFVHVDSAVQLRLTL